ncbi:glycosyltransferase family 4 protein [Candidatus Woesebacteria bacterium]|nr:glycosyltransferase family 4 protein [Candidatus Woesebacteria bacterium]
MKILMLTPYLPYPPASGGQIRTLYLLKYLSANHDITLVSLYKHDEEKQYTTYLKQYCKSIHVCKRAENPWQLSNIVGAVFSKLPFLIVRNFSKEAQAVIETLLKRESFDVIHAETFYIMPHIPETTIPVLLVEQTIEYRVYQHFISSLPFFLRFPLLLDIHKLKFWEKYYWRKATLVATVSAYDKRQLMLLEPSVEPVIIPNGAGDDMFVKHFEKKNLQKARLLFVGNFSWLQNIEAAEYLVEYIFPKLKKRVKNIELIIVGQNSHQKLKLHRKKGVVIDDIPPAKSEKVKDYYRSATLFLAPIFGPGGTRLKILASMASGVPVVSTTTGVEGLGIEPGKEALVANDVEGFVDSIVSILQDKKKYDTVRKNAFELVKRQYSWKMITKQLELVYNQIT